MPAKKVLLPSVLIMVALVVVSIFSRLNHSKEEVIKPADSPKNPVRGFFIGVLPVPGDNQSFEEAYSQAARYAEFSPVWGRPTPFYSLAGELSGSWGREFIDKNIRGNGMFPLIHVSFIGPNVTLVTPPGMRNASLSNPVWREAYKQAVIDVVKSSRPLYLSIGNEVNRWYEKYGMEGNNPNGFQHFVSLYEEIYDAVKKLSPETKVFCTFAREIISENREADLTVLSMFKPEKMDLIMFTSYPYAVRGINRPSNIPDNYYVEALSHLPGKPFGFSELGWPSIDVFGGEQAQADFLTQVVGRLTREQGINLHMLGWAWLHDLDEKDSIGLVKRNGEEKLAYDVWKNISRPSK
ncbi:MAG: hypothetical protein QW542_01260 [Thermoproteota archaeon]